MCVYVYVCVCMYVRMCLYTYIDIRVTTSNISKIYSSLYTVALF